MTIELPITRPTAFFPYNVLNKSQTQPDHSFKIQHIRAGDVAQPLKPPPTVPAPHIGTGSSSSSSTSDPFSAIA